MSDSNEAPLRIAFLAAIQTRDIQAARRSVQAMAVQRHGPAFGLEERLWQVLTAYAAMVDSKPDRATIRRSVQTSFVASGPAFATINLQAWAKPRRFANTLAMVGLGDMTCEGAMLEMPQHFSADMVTRARRFLAEQRSALR